MKYKYILPKLLIPFLAVSALAGCATINKGLKSLVGRTESEPAQKKTAKVTRFSEDQNAPVPGAPRSWQRMTKDRFEREAQVNGSPGSLWVMEGQSSYMFSSNVLRLPGEVVNVKMDGAPKNQLETKVKVIKQMLARLDKPKRKPAAINPAAKSDVVTPQQPPAEASPTEAAGADKEKSDDAQMLVESVPARIVDRTVEGNYRIKGTQNFMIGKREYRVIVTGLVRPNDVNGDQVKADQILDPKFDIVSMKKELKL